MKRLTAAQSWVLQGWDERLPPLPRDNPSSAAAMLLAEAGDLPLYRPDTTGFLMSPGIYVMLQVGVPQDVSKDTARLDGVTAQMLWRQHGMALLGWASTIQWRRLKEQQNPHTCKNSASVFSVVWVISGFLQEENYKESKNLTALKQQILPIHF